MKQFYRNWIRPPLYAFYLGIALSAFTNIGVNNWRYYAIVVPLVAIVVFTKEDRP